MSSIRFSKAVGTLVAVVWATSVMCYAIDDLPNAAATSQNSSLYLKIRLDRPAKLSKLKPGDIVQGKLARSVFSAERELFPVDSSVRLKVDHMEKRRRAPDDHWPWLVKVFTPRHEKYPIFKTALVSGSGRESALQVSLVSVGRRREVHAQAKREKKGQRDGENKTVEVSKSGGMYGPRNLSTPMMVLEAFNLEPGAATAVPDLSALENLPAGTAFKILLLGDISASRSRAGDTIRARLLEPVFLNSRLALPAGSLVEGKVLKQTPPRWGSRAGAISLTFTGVTLPGGNSVPISASLVGAELDRSSHTRIDAEGQLKGERPGKAWMAINLGVTAGLAKEVDDGTQLIVEALISTATDASTAGTARIVSSCISGIFMVTRHGRDVVLPRFTEMDIALDRPLSVSKDGESAPSIAIVRAN